MPPYLVTDAELATITEAMAAAVAASTAAAPVVDAGLSRGG